MLRRVCESEFNRYVPLARDLAVENWLVQQAGRAYDALKADPSRALTADEVNTGLATEHAKAQPNESSGRILA